MGRRMWDKNELVTIAEEHGGGSGAGVTKQYVDGEIRKVEAKIPSVEGLTSEQYVHNYVAEQLVNKQDKLESYSDRASIVDNTLTINYKVRQEDGSYSDVPVSFAGGGGTGGSTEVWTFTLADGSVVTKEVYVK